MRKLKEREHVMNKISSNREENLMLNEVFNTLGGEIPHHCRSLKIHKQAKLKKFKEIFLNIL